MYVYIYTHKLLLAKGPQAREYLGCPGVLSDVPCKALSPPLISRFPESHNKKKPSRPVKIIHCRNNLI